MAKAKRKTKRARASFAPVRQLRADIQSLLAAMMAKSINEVQYPEFRQSLKGTGRGNE
jgi:hypothetical protein